MIQKRQQFLVFTALIAITAGSAPTLAGVITGNGKPI